MKLEFSRHFFEKSSKSNFKNARHVEAEMLHGDRRDTDRQADVKNLIVAFRNFANKRKKCFFLQHGTALAAYIKNNTIKPVKIHSLTRRLQTVTHFICGEDG